MIHVGAHMLFMRGGGGREDLTLHASKYKPKVLQAIAASPIHSNLPRRQLSLTKVWSGSVLATDSLIQFVLIQSNSFQ